MSSNELSEKCCAVCNKFGRYMCTSCLDIGKKQFYCCKAHQNEDWPTHKHICMPYRFEENGLHGRHLVSSRNIKKGDIVLKEEAIIVAPDKSCAPMCPSCYESIKRNNKCRNCRWPMCSKSICRKAKVHSAECGYTKKNGIVKNIKQFQSVHPYYAYIAPLRCLYARDNYPAKYKIISEMESKKEERTNKGKLEMAKNMKKYFKLDDFSLDEVMHCCGVVEVNHFRFRRCTPKIGLYENARFLIHSCIPNTYASFNVKDEIVIKASVDIPKDTILFVSHAFLYASTRVRQDYFLKPKHIKCVCRRCKDPTEFGTYMGSVTCESCLVGYMLPPLGLQKNWVCQNCHQIGDSNLVLDFINNWHAKAYTIRTIAQCEKFLYETMKIFPENHYLRIEVKMNLCIACVQNFGSVKGGTFSKKINSRRREAGYDLKKLTEIDNLNGLSCFRGMVLNMLLLSQVALALHAKGVEKRWSILKECSTLYPEILSTFVEDSICPIERKAYDQTLLAEMVVSVHYKRD